MKTGNPSVGVSLVTRAVAGALRVADSETSALIADSVIRNRDDGEYLQRDINDAEKIDYVRGKIAEAIAALGVRVTSELTAFRNVNRVFLVGGGASLIEEGISVACRENQPEPDVAEIRAVMKAIGAMTMADYRREGVTNSDVSDLLARQREAANRLVSVPASLLSRILRDYERELERRTGQAWEAGRPEPESVQNARKDVYALKDALAA